MLKFKIFLNLPEISRTKYYLNLPIKERLSFAHERFLDSSQARSATSAKLNCYPKKSVTFWGPRPSGSNSCGCWRFASLSTVTQKCEAFSWGEAESTKSLKSLKTALFYRQFQVSLSKWHFYYYILCFFARGQWIGLNKGHLPFYSLCSFLLVNSPIIFFNCFVKLRNFFLYSFP